MSHSAISATTTMNYDLEFSLHGSNNNFNVAFEIEKTTKVLDRILFVGSSSFEKVINFDIINPLDIDDTPDLIYIQNLDSENFCHVAVTNGGAIGDSISFKIPANKFMLFTRDKFYAGNLLFNLADTAIKDVRIKFDTHEGVVRVIGLSTKQS